MKGRSEDRACFERKTEKEIIMKFTIVVNVTTQNSL